jgi:nucleotide-binding universal stress UspA family protein
MMCAITLIPNNLLITGTLEEGRLLAVKMAWLIINGIILGASRDSLLRQVVHGNIPETLTRNSNCTVVLVRT